jgi:4'-phosphopantetheinyl transferase EntD
MDWPDEVEAQLRTALDSLGSPAVRLGCRRISSTDVLELHEVEAAHIRRAVPERQREFASGRVLLRALMGNDVAVPVAPDRSPVLPDGVRASLAHDREFAVAAVSRDASVLALGIDLEPTTPLEPDLATLVMRRDEPGIDPHLGFTMKEATYKAWSALGGRVLDHADVHLVATGRRFRARVVADGSWFEGAWASAGGRWIALVVARARRLDAGR